MLVLERVKPAVDADRLTAVWGGGVAIRINAHTGLRLEDELRIGQGRLPPIWIGNDIVHDGGGLKNQGSMRQDLKLIPQ